jgi:hypothetical protein
MVALTLSDFSMPGMAKPIFTRSIKAMVYIRNAAGIMRIQRFLGTEAA